MDELSVLIQEILKRYVGAVGKDLQISIKDVYPGAVIRSGSWANQNIITAYVSFSTTNIPSEDSIDFMLQLTLLGTDAKFQADISRSNGELIADITNEFIKFNSRDDFLSQVESHSLKASEAFSAKFHELDSWIN